MITILVEPSVDYSDTAPPRATISKKFTQHDGGLRIVGHMSTNWNEIRYPVALPAENCIA